MFYYFDESGNWQETGNKETRIIAGIIVNSEKELYKIKSELDAFKAKNAMSNLHSTDIKGTLYEELVNTFASMYEQKLFKAFVRLIPEFTIIMEQSVKTLDKIYIDIASDLISSIVIADNDRKIYFDPKFHNTYAENIIRNIRKKEAYPYELRNLMYNYEIKSDKTELRKSQILSRKFNKMYSQDVKDFKAMLEKADGEKLEKILKDWDFSEMAIYIDENVKLRELFRGKVEDNLYKFSKDFGINDDCKINIEYLGKNDKSVNIAGIETVDFICNFFWRINKSRSKPSGASYVKIIENTVVKEV